MNPTRSLATKKSWANPETREKMLEGARKGREAYIAAGRPGPYRGPARSKKEPKMPKRIQKSWTGVELKQLEKLIEAHLPWADIARILGRPYYSVVATKPARAEMARRTALREEHYYAVTGVQLKLAKKSPHTGAISELAPSIAALGA